MFASRSRMFIAVLAAAAFTLAQAAGEDIAFMPKGGKTLLIELMGASSAQLRSIAQERRTEAQWRDFIDAQKKPVTEKQRATLAAYLFVNLPVASAVQGAPVLPPDGRELAWNGCQNCHSLFAGYLTQDREPQAWRNLFLSPFHRDLKMSPQEREEFARYSAINMPLKIEDVPPDLRF
ncbi:MAG TPA: hypothetical protein VN663_11765 [Ramlibacter sp.]|nr:hypothetical protein [Ramlibacter sp.]